MGNFDERVKHTIMGVESDFECKKSGWCVGWLVKVSGENRGKSRPRQTGSQIIEAPPFGGDQNHVWAIFHIRLCF